MAARRKPRAAEAQLAFEALSIEGGLLSPEWLARAAQLQAGDQTEADYRVPKGLNLRDEIGRYWRIAQAHWKDFAAGRTSGADPCFIAERFVTSLLRDSFGFVTLVASPASREAEGRSFPVGHFAIGHRVPVVIAPAGGGLDTPSPAFGDDGRRRSAFGLVQEYLNAEDAALWGIACDGVTLRILRDNASMTRPAWIEADLGRIFSEERYADFAALWLLAHETRFGRADQPVTECALEAWRTAGREEGTRAREFLRRGVEDALVALGQGFLAHPENATIRTALQDGKLSTTAYFQQLLRVVYRLIFLLTAEERGVLHPDGAGEAARVLYADGYGLKRLRERSTRRSAHDRFSDLWESAKITFRGLARSEPRLALPALAGIFAADQCATLDAARLENRALLTAVFRLSWIREDSGLSRVNWRDMGPEELGSVYESLLELVPQIGQGGRTFAFAAGGEAMGNARKTTGSYYTPDSLVQVLLDSALEPIVLQTIAAHPEKPGEALLELAIVDPACGSGHFLLAAARRLAAHVARFQANGTPSAAEYRHALRQVVGRCIYGVDLNPMAVELCKVSLWMEAVEPGRPLSFLDSHIQHGNALLGATPDLMSNGIPDAAWEPIEGDDRKVASALKKRNKQSAAVHRGLDLLWTTTTEAETAQIGDAVAAIEATSDADAEQLARKEWQHRELLASRAFRHQQFVADAWCAAFVWPKHGGALADAAPTNDVWAQLRDGRGAPTATLVTAVGEIAEQYRFFHWHLAFPHVFARGGFDVVLGNPPWEELTPSAKEFFSVYEPEIRSQDKAGEEVITSRLLQDSTIASAWTSHCRLLFGEVHSLKSSGRHVLFAPGNLGKGDFNVYRMFVETAMAIVRDGGFAAQFIPETFYAGATTMAIRRKLLESFDWQLLVGIENAGEVWFKGVDTRAKFCLYAARKGSSTVRLRVAFNVRSPAQLAATLSSADAIYITPDLIRSFSPDALAIMELGSRTDVELATKMHSAWPPFGSDQSQPPMHKHMRELDMTTDSALFRTTGPGLPVYEGRMVGQFDHRAKGYGSGKARSADWIDFAFSDPTKRIQPQYYVRAQDLPAKLGDRLHRYRVGFCNIASPTNERSLVATLIPKGSVCGNKVPTITFEEGYEWYGALWIAVANSFVMDFLVRKKVSLTMTNTIIDSLPFPNLLRTDVRAHRLVPLAARLCCVGGVMQPYWDMLASDGWVAPLDTEKDGLVDAVARRAIEAEINAVVALQLFDLRRDELSYIMDTFPIVRKRDEKAYGEYRTKTLILKVFDSMAEATRTGIAYVTRLDLPPADPSVTRTPPALPSRAVLPTLVRLPAEQDIASFVFAALHARGGAMPQIDLARALALRVRPDVVINVTPNPQEATHWKTQRRGHEATDVKAGMLASVLRGCETRSVLRRAVDPSGHVVSMTTEHTPALDRIDGWFHFEARVLLDAVKQLAVVDPPAVEALVSAATRRSLEEAAG